MSQEVRMVLFGLVAFTVLGLGSWYVGQRLGASLPGRWRIVVWLFWSLLVLLVPAAFSLMQLAEGAPWHRTLYVSGFTLLGLLSLLFAGVLAADIVRGIAALTDRVGEWLGWGHPTACLLPEDPERRRLLGHLLRGGIALGAVLLTGCGLRRTRMPPEVEDVSLAIPDLPPALEEFRIVQISDLHVCPDITRTEVAALVKQANALKPDLVAFTGDLADGQVNALAADVAPLAELQARHGVFFVTGNHEYYSDLPGWLAEVRRLGMHVLLNEHRVIHHDGASMLVAGVTDLSAGGMEPSHATDPDRAVAGAPECPVRLMLAHQPRSAYRAIELGMNVVLCGHTHGGQFFPWNQVVGWVQPFVSGLYRHRGAHVYTNRGTGFWGPPLRDSRGAEVTLLRLVRA